MMEINVSKISNHAQNPNNPDNSVFEMKGQKGLGCLVEGYNTPKEGGNSVESKVTRILVESFMKRPALSNEAMANIFERANNGLMVTQSPQYPSYAAASAIFFLKNKFVYATAGDNVIFHFVDGKLADVFCCDPGEEPQYLGVPGYAQPKIGDVATFSKGTHTFLICSAAFANAMDEGLLEGSLSANTHFTDKGKQKLAEVKCDRWLRELKDNINGYHNSNDNYSAIAFSIPPRKKSKLLLIIIIIVAVLVIAGGFFLFGARRKPPQQGGPQQGQEEMLGPNGERPPAPPAGAKPGDEQPAPPTRPAQQ